LVVTANQVEIYACAGRAAPTLICVCDRGIVTDPTRATVKTRVIRNQPQPDVVPSGIHQKILKQCKIAIQRLMYGHFISTKLVPIFQLL
jgi:hypothetical protein